MTKATSNLTTGLFVLFVYKTRAVSTTGVVEAEETTRQLVIFDKLFPEHDVCAYGRDEDNYGPCDTRRFPVCQDKELICYNRRPFRSNFYTDIRQPKFYIDYNLVKCYPENWEGCSSCSPGRYCLSENRCILDDMSYPCAKWI